MRPIIDEINLSCFQIVREVLDELYYQLPLEKEGKWRGELIQEKLSGLIVEYEKLKQGNLLS